MDLILTVDDYKKLRQIEDSTRDDQLLLAAEGATDAILQHTDRAFTDGEVTEERSFPYDGSGILEIDDCTSIQTLEVNGRVLVPDVDFFAEPSRGPGQTYYWLDLATVRGISPAMGFTRNEDVYASNWSQRRHKPQRYQAKLTATFGWAAVPASVRIAASWLIDEMAPASPGGDAEAGGHEAESIADLAFVNRSAEDRETQATLPPKVLTLLLPFERWSV